MYILQLLIIYVITSGIGFVLGFLPLIPIIITSGVTLFVMIVLLSKPIFSEERSTRGFRTGMWLLIFLFPNLAMWANYLLKK